MSACVVLLGVVGMTTSSRAEVPPDLFDESRLHVLHLRILEDAPVLDGEPWWEFLVVNGVAGEIQVPGILRVDDHPEWYTVLVKHRGGESFLGSVASLLATNEFRKRPFDIELVDLDDWGVDPADHAELDGLELNDDGELWGVDTIELLNGQGGPGWLEPSFMHDVLNRKIMKQALPMPRTSFARLHVHPIPPGFEDFLDDDGGVSMGLFVLREHGDKQYMERIFRDGDGCRYTGIDLDDSCLDVLSAMESAVSDADPIDPEGFFEGIDPHLDLDGALWSYASWALCGYSGEGVIDEMFEDRFHAGRLHRVPQGINNAAFNSPAFLFESNAPMSDGVNGALGLTMAESPWLRARYLHHLRWLAETTDPAQVACWLSAYRPILTAELDSVFGPGYTYYWPLDPEDPPSGTLDGCEWLGVEQYNDCLYEPILDELQSDLAAHRQAILDATANQLAAPVISGVGFDSTPDAGASVTVTATVVGACDDCVHLYWRDFGGFRIEPMVNVAGDDWEANLADAGSLQVTQLYVEAFAEVDDELVVSYHPPLAGQGPHEAFSFNAAGPATGDVADLHINEFLATGSGPDWIEIYNAGSVAVNVCGLVLADEAEPEEPFALPDEVIQPGGYLVVEADGLGIGLHADFKISKSGGELYLFGPEDEGMPLIDVVSYRRQARHVSQGRWWNGVDRWKQFPDPTPHWSNPIPGDYDSDGVVNVNDLLVLLGAMGCSSPDEDLTGDGAVDTQDILAFLQYFGSTWITEVPTGVEPACGE
ncbi:MAG: lamin tail domain-containing protein [Acidobacteriota bacterium]